jgi:hypothetical protein
MDHSPVVAISFSQETLSRDTKKRSQSYDSEEEKDLVPPVDNFVPIAYHEGEELHLTDPDNSPGKSPSDL